MPSNHQLVCCLCGWDDKCPIHAEGTLASYLHRARYEIGQSDDGGCNARMNTAYACIDAAIKMTEQQEQRSSALDQQHLGQYRDPLIALETYKAWYLQYPNETGYSVFYAGWKAHKRLERPQAELLDSYQSYEEQSDPASLQPTSLHEIGNSIKSDISDELRELATDMEASANYLIAHYGQGIILEYQMDHRDIGYEARLLRHVADLLDKDKE